MIIHSFIPKFLYTILHVSHTSICVPFISIFLFRYIAFQIAISITRQLRRLDTIMCLTISFIETCFTLFFRVTSN
jgi:hypothetical protein